MFRGDFPRGEIVKTWEYGNLGISEIRISEFQFFSVITGGINTGVHRKGRSVVDTGHR